MTQPDSVRLVLPWPPSVNHYWRHARGRHYISVRGNSYRQAVFWAVKDQARTFTKFPKECRLNVAIVARPPDRIARDLDNLLKATLDALQHAGVYADDSQIDGLSVIRSRVVPGGELLVLVSQIGEGKP